MFTRGSLTLFRVRGVPVRAHWTLLLVLPYLAFALSAQLASATYALLWGALLAIGLFASVALHELAHTFVARRHGGRVRGITLMLLGGVSHVTRLPPRPRSEALMAAAGPVTSLALGAVLGAAWWLTGSIPLFYLASMNLMLGVFNFLPAFPMDGGRVLRALLATRMGQLRATQIAAGIGRGLAIAMVLVGIATGSLLLILVAVFVFVGAGAEADSERAKAALEGVTLAQVLPVAARVPAIGADDVLADALPRMRAVARQELIVVDETGAPVSVLTAADVAQVPPGLRLSMAVRELVATLGPRFVAIDLATQANEALELAADSGVPYVVVTSRAGGLALLSSGDVATAIALRLAEAPRLPPASARPGLA